MQNISEVCWGQYVFMSEDKSKQNADRTKQNDFRTKIRNFLHQNISTCEEETYQNWNFPKKHIKFDKTITWKV